MQGRERGPLGPQLRPGEPEARLQAALDTRDHVHALLQTVAAIGGQFELDVVLRQIVAAAVRLAAARYGAIGITGEDGQLTEFLPVGLESDHAARLGHWPAGSGLLGELMAGQRPVRLADISTSGRAAGFPDGHPPMRSFLGAPLRIGDEAYGGLYVTDKRGGGPFDDEDEALVAALAAAAGVAVDKARLYAEAQRQRQWVRANAEVTQQLLSDDEPSQVLDMVARQALQISGADLVWLALPDGNRETVVVEHAVGDGAAELLGITSPAGRSAAGIVMASGKPLIIDDLDTDARVAPVVRGHARLGAAILVPLGPAGDVRGVLGAGRRSGAPPLSPAAVEMVTTFAAQAGIGVELAERRQDAQRVALFADRDRIARDLHDQVIQRLFATGMSLQGATSLIPGTEAADRVQHAVDDLDETIGDIRAAIFTLQSRDDPDRPGVQARIVAIVEEMTGTAAFAPSLRMDGRLDSRVPPEVAEEMLAALREALSNAARHSGASRVGITVESGPELVLTVQDNGAGISRAGRPSGLANLAERAAGLGGTLLVAAVPGGGTELRWRVPLPAAAPG
jgi:GAF domain-containing protein